MIGEMKKEQREHERERKDKIQSKQKSIRNNSSMNMEVLSHNNISLDSIT